MARRAASPQGGTRFGAALQRSLAGRAADGGWWQSRTGPPGIDVHTATSGEARRHRKGRASARTLHVDKNTLDTMLVKAGVAAKRN